MCNCDISEKILDPITGLYVCCENCNEICNETCSDYSENYSENYSEKSSEKSNEEENAEMNNKKPPKLSVLISDLFTPDCVCQCVNLAVLFNYEDEKDDTNFATIFLPEFKIDYKTLTKVFFNDFGKNFSNHILDKIWSGLTGFSLANTVLEKFEDLNGIDRNKISAIKMIQLHKECAIKKITTNAKKTYALSLSEFTNALSSVDVREDGNICANIVLNLFFNSLKIGVKITLRFAISDVPKNLIGKLSNDDNIGFKFCKEKHINDFVTIVLEDDC
jgi:hypothetical protein